MKLTNKNQETKWILLGIPIIFLLGSLCHFIYELTGNLALVGSVTPVNESIWEHTKLALLPMLCWWLLWYLARGKKLRINKNNWFVATFVATSSVPVLIVFFYYTYSTGFNIHSLAMDIFSFFISVTIGQLLGLHLYKHGSFSNKGYLTSIILMTLLILVFIILTFTPPHLPVFMDNNTGLYGIPK